MHFVLPVLLLLTSFIFVAPAYSSQPDNSAVILMYHNVSEDTPPSTSVTPATFSQHMQYLADNEFTIWPLFKTLVHLATGRPVPAKTVVLTFDDAYSSVYSEAFPLLKEKGWPFTVFVTTQYMGEGYSNYMSWAQLREMQKSGAEVGNHSLTHPHLIRHRTNETQQQWRTRITAEIEQAQDILRQQVSNPVRAVAYPYGEFSKEVREILWELGYFGLGQHSGAAGYRSDFQGVPRFPMATGYDALEDFAIKVSTKSLPLKVLSHADGVISADTEIPVLRVQLLDGDYNKSCLSCYAPGQGRIQVAWLEDNIVTIQANQAIKPGRTKYNCTVPSNSGKGIFYWFSYLWMKPEANGEWYQE